MNAPREEVPSKVGRYAIVEAIGFGAMGAVYKAFDPLIKRTIAIKTIRLDIPRRVLTIGLSSSASIMRRGYRARFPTPTSSRCSTSARRRRRSLFWRWSTSTGRRSPTY